MAARCGAFARSVKPAFHSLRAAAEAGGRSASSAARASSCKNTMGNDSSRFRNSFVSYSRLPAELGCVMSMMPLHNVVATARLTSHLSLNSRSCGALSQAAEVAYIAKAKPIDPVVDQAVDQEVDPPVRRETWVATAAAALYIESDPTASVAPVAVAVRKPYPVTSFSMVPPTA